MMSEQRTGRSGRLTRALLLGSVCLNLVLGGYIAVQLVAAETRPVAAMLTPRLLDRVASQLPPQDADILRQVFRRRALEVRTARAELDKAIAEALEQLGQPELDVAKLRAAVENAREKRNRQGDILLEGFFEALERISPEGRKALVTRFSRR
jgi:uncharacterized membrane protein